jgi:hypothetical protein
MKMGAVTTSTTLDDGQQEFPTAQLEDELVFKGEEMSWSRLMGQRPTQANATPLGWIHHVAQIRLGLWFDCLGAKSPLCI